MKIKVNNVNYHVEVIGNGEPVLLLHGFTGDTSTWSSLSKQLMSHFQVILIDILGHGLTESPNDSSRYDIELITNDLKEILMALEVEHVNILGYSMGGRLALTFARTYPELMKSLILESASPGLLMEEDRRKRRRQDELLGNKIVDEGIESFVEYWTKIPLFATQKMLPQTVQKSIRLQRLTNNPVGLANSLIGMGTGSQPSWWNDLDSLQFPILLITGALDKKFCRIASEMKNKLINAVHVTIPNVGHAIHVESPEKFGTIVMEFLTNKKVHEN